MKGAPYRPRLEGRFLRFARRAARLNRNLRHGLFAATRLPGVVHADGDPVPGQIGFQVDAAPIADKIEFFRNWIWFSIIPAICLPVPDLLISSGFECDSRMIRGADLRPGDIPSSPWRTKRSCRREKLAASK